MDRNTQVCVCVRVRVQKQKTKTNAFILPLNKECEIKNRLENLESLSLFSFPTIIRADTHKHTGHLAHRDRSLS